MIPAVLQARSPATAHYRDKGQLPDPRCTPGSFDPIVTQSDIRATICKGGLDGSPSASSGVTDGDLQVWGGLSRVRDTPGG